MIDEAATHGVQALLDVFVMFAAAKLFEQLFRFLRQPTVVGEILAGVLIGPSVLGWVLPSEISSVLSEIGVVILLFAVGLQTKPADILDVGGTAMAVAVLGVVFPFFFGWWLMEAVGDPSVSSLSAEALFVGAAMVATSVGITAHVLGEMGVIKTRAARIILGAAVIDDVLGLLVLAVVSGMSEGAVDVSGLTVTTIVAIVFVLGVGFVGAKLMRRARRQVARMRATDTTFAFAMVLCFGLALAAETIGIAAILGGFLAGMSMAETSQHNRKFHERTRGVYELMVPFFLVAVGMELQLEVFTERETVELALALTALAILGKLIGCGLGAIRTGRRDMLRVAVGMVPRGEVGIIIAQIGLASGAISQSLFGAVLFMAVATTLLAPPFLRPLYRAGTD